MQPWNGKLSHFTRESKYALDFDMPEGDTICAARGGIVIRTIDHFTENGGKELKDKANQVVVLHDDGTMAFYVHLLHRGVLVEAGDTIRKGQIIGLSGNTGYSTKPHLHFVVREAPDKSVPMYFKGYQGRILKKGRKVGY
ncbi:MAG: M23 family metallopeptidase [Saprospiraceae bacterium]|nr:M23 family metallopeptidase [Saprospiraceae bacterium]